MKQQLLKVEFKNEIDLSILDKYFYQELLNEILKVMSVNQK